MAKTATQAQEEPRPVRSGREATPPASRFAAAVATLKPVARETVQDQVYREVRKGLIYGLFVPGQVLTILDLARTLNTSTMPVRDALSRLISEQALEAMPNRSVRVPLITSARLEDLRRVRMLLECEALTLAVPRLTPDDLQTARRLIREHDFATLKRGDISLERELEANWAFHFHLYQASHSAVLMPFIESLWLQLGPIIHAAADVFDPTSPVSNLRYHVDIIDALEVGDLPAAREALPHDIGRTCDLLQAPLAAADGGGPHDR